MFRTLALAGLVALTLPSRLQAAEPPMHTGVSSLADELALMRIPADVEIAVDDKDWSRARSFFAEEVRVDFSTLSGAPPATIKSDDLIAGWSGNLKGNKESLHMRGHPLVIIDGDTATVTSNGYAYNKMPGAPDGSGDLWEVWGRYTHVFTRTPEGWRIKGFAFAMKHERGSEWVKVTPGTP
jgi:ketosteroid isomerase-like protein